MHVQKRMKQSAPWGEKKIGNRTLFKVATLSVQKKTTLTKLMSIVMT